MSDMEYKKFSTFIDSVQYGYTADETSTVEGDAKYLRITDIVPYFVDKDRVPFCKISDKNRIKYLVTENDLLIARTGATTGYNLIVPKGFDNYVFASYLVRFNYNQDELYPQYLKHVLKSQQYYGFVKNYIGGSAQPGMNPKAFGRFEVPYVEYDKQKRIAEILSAYDDLIENNNRRIALLEKAAQELYKEWFVRFRFSGYENVKFENGLPEGWKLKKIGDIFDVTSSKRVFLSDYVEEGVPFYRSKEIIQLSQGKTLTEPLYISNEAYTYFNDKFGSPQKNDILITSVGTIGVSYLVDGHKFYFKDGNLTWIKSGTNPVLAFFIFRWLNSPQGKQQLLQSTIGTSQSALTIENLKNIKILVPCEMIIQKYYDLAYVMAEEKRILEWKNKNLAKQRDLLLPRLMSGNLEV